MQLRDATVTARLRRVPFLTGTVALLLALAAFPVFVGTVVNLPYFRDVGYPDSAILVTVRDFAHSGRIYPPLDRPPYMVTVYGPLTYVLFGIPYRFAEFVGLRPDVAVRLVVVFAFTFCLYLVFLLSYRLHGTVRAAGMSVLFAVAVVPLATWTTQVRPDFAALALSLLSVYLVLFGGTRWHWVAAVLCAGTAPLIKQTFVATAVGVAVWLASTRRLKQAAVWASGVLGVVAAGYSLAAWREPLMLSHLGVLKQPVLNFRGALDIFWLAISQPVVPFAAAGAALAVREGGRERGLLLVLGAASWLLATVTIPQVGANINYFWEPLLISALLAGSVPFELQRRLTRTSTFVAMMLVLLLIHSSLPTLRSGVNSLKQYYYSVATYSIRKARWESFVSAVAGLRVLSTIPAVTIHSSSPEVPDPFLNSFLERRGWNSAAVIADIEAARYALIVVAKNQAAEGDFYRGIPVWSDKIWSAVKRNYGLACLYEGMEIWLPRQGRSEVLHRLRAIGCETVSRSRRNSTGRVGHEETVGLRGRIAPQDRAVSELAPQHTDPTNRHQR